LVADRVSNFKDSDGAVIGDGPRSFQGNVIVSDRPTEGAETPMTMTIHADQFNSYVNDSYEDDFHHQNSGVGGYTATATEKGLQEPHIILQSQHNSQNRHVLGTPQSEERSRYTETYEIGSVQAIEKLKNVTH
jgi:hypothetical protein